MFKKGASRGGVDNLRYTYEVLEPLLILFWQELMAQRHEPDEFKYDILPYVFQQDNAPSYASKWTQRRLEKEGIPVLEHIRNSPEMNAIEGVWMPLRIAITKEWNTPHTTE